MEDTKNKNQDIKYPHKALEAIEKDRVDFFAYYRKSNTIQSLVTGISLAIIVICLFLMPVFFPEDPNLSTTINIIVAVLCLGGSLVYTVLSKKKTDVKMRDFFKNFHKNTNDYVFDSKDYSEAMLLEPSKITMEEFNDCKLFKDICEVGSRGLTFFKYKDKPMTVVDCAGKVKAERSIATAFLGKRVVSKTSYKEKTPIFVYLKGNELALPPTALGDVKIVENNDKYTIWSDSKNWSKVINQQVLKLIVDIKTNNNLVDLSISLYDGNAYVMMGYDDPIMIPPLKDPFNANPTIGFKKDLEKVCKILEALQ